MSGTRAGSPSYPGPPEPAKPNPMTYAIALLLCILAAAFEGLCAGRDPLAQLKATRQPRWSPPNWVWVLIGIAWYGNASPGSRGKIGFRLSGMS